MNPIFKVLKTTFYYILFFVASYLQAQQPVSIHLTEKDGLPDIEFYDIIEDSKGFIWLASDNGLYRYDGRNYKPYEHSKQKGNAVFALKEDFSKRIWYTNIAGQFFFVNEHKTELFIDLGSYLNGSLADFVLTQKFLFVLSERNIYSIDLENKEVQIQLNSNDSHIGVPMKVDNHFYYVQNNFIEKRDLKFSKVDAIELDIFDNYSNDSGIARRINVAANDSLYFCYFNKFDKNLFYRFDMERKTYSQLDVPDILQERIINHITFINSEMWVSTDQGIIIFNIQRNALIYQRVLFKGIFITKIIEDVDRNFWVSTKGDGIFVIPNINIFSFDLPSKLQNVTSLVTLDLNNVILGTTNGHVASYNLETHKVNVIDSSSVFKVTNFTLDHSGEKLIVSKEDKALQYIVDSHNIIPIENDLLKGAKKLTTIDTSGYILSSYKNLAFLNQDYHSTKNLIRKRSYTNFYNKKSGEIYASTVDGLYLFDRNFNRYKINYLNAPILVNSFSKSDDNIVWVSTFNDGVYGIKNKDIIAHYTKENGLLSNKIGLIKNHKNSLWITSEKGIQAIDFREGTFKNLTKQIGIPSYRISDIKTIENKIIFASNVGVFYFDIHKLDKTKVERELYITEVKIDDKESTIEDRYGLNYDQNKIEISFNINGFQSDITNRYTYRLSGIDKEWKVTNELINTVNYNSLPSGSYIFEVKKYQGGSNSKRIHIHIEKPYWNKWWFYLIIICSVSAFTYSIFIYKVKLIEKKQSELLQKELLNKQLVFSQLENLRSQMNPHFIFNALNSIQEYIVLNEKILASSFLIKFSRLIRIYLDHSRENEVLLIDELKALKIYLELEKNRFEESLEFNISIPDTINIRAIKIPSLFLQPYVENAIKHGLLHKKENRRLFISFEINEVKDILICKIEDNGIGREASKKINAARRPFHNSFATTANQKRVALLNTNKARKIEVDMYDIDTLEETGTRVLIKIPLNFFEI